MPENNDQEKTSNNPNLEAKFLVEKNHSKHSQLIAARIRKELNEQTIYNTSTIKTENNKIS
jgi:hypothetical protein